MSLPPLTPPSRRRGLQIDSLLFFDTPSAMMQGKNRLFRRVDPARRGRPFCYPPSEATGVFRAAIDMAAAPQRGANPSFATEELGEVVCPNNNEQPAAHTSPNSRADRLLPSFGGAGGGGLPLQLATKHSSLLSLFSPLSPFFPRFALLPPYSWPQSIRPF